MFEEKKLLYRVTTKKDADAYAKIYDHYVESIYRFIFFKVNNVHEAEDLTSEVFLKVWQYLISAKGQSVRHLRGLFYRTARNIVIDTYRERARKPVDSLDQAESLPDESITIGIEEKDAYRLLLISIKRLKQEYQEVLLLRYVEDMSISDMAVILDKKKAAVRVLLHRATKKLQSVHKQQQ